VVRGQDNDTLGDGHVAADLYAATGIKSTPRVDHRILANAQTSPRIETTAHVNRNTTGKLEPHNRSVISEPQMMRRNRRDEAVTEVQNKLSNETVYGHSFISRSELGQLPFAADPKVSYSSS
jgi:hypothetical protein